MSQTLFKIDDDTNEKRQDNELAALQAIYGNAVVDNRQPVVWKIWRPLDILLTLYPSQSSSSKKEVHCSITLHIKCCPNYPDKPPDIAIHQLRGISIENGASLLEDLYKLAMEHLGEVCIFQIAVHVQQYLCKYNEPQLSFYEQMVKEKTEQEKLKLHDLKVKENEERQKMKEEIQKRQEVLRSAGRQRSHRSSVSQETDSLEGKGDGEDTTDLVYYADDIESPVKKATGSRTVDVPCTCKNKGLKIIRISHKNHKKVYIGNCLGHSSNGSTTYLAIDDDGERLVAKKWIVSTISDFQTRNRQLTSIQNDLKTMSRLNHPSLIPYIAMEICKEASKRPTKQYIFLFRQFVLGTSLKYVKRKLFVNKELYECLKLIRHVGLGVLSALKELHSVGLVHRDVRVEKVYLDDFGSVKLVGIDLDMTLAEMLHGESSSDRQTFAQDIYATGQLLLSILSREETCTDVPTDLPSIAKDFFARCLTEDEDSQWTAEQLINHSFLVDAPDQLVEYKGKDENASGSDDDDALKRIPQTSSMMNGHSRLNVEFEVLAWLGKGAFGDVLKVKNKLDGGFYAIKRIKLNPESVQLNKKITREVKLLSSLNHENVVRYYNAWIESTIIEQEEVDSEESKTPDIKSPAASLEGVVAKLVPEVKVEWSMSEGQVQKTNLTSDSEDSDEDDEREPWCNMIKPKEESSCGIQFEVGSNQSQTIPSEEAGDASKGTTCSERIQKVLYLQMEFCEKHTLRQAIDKGLHRENYRAWRLFREIVEGLAHVHQRGVIHRDLKPVNIFLDSQDHVKIGDFGLATKVFTAPPSADEKTKPEEPQGSLTGQIGTALYVAPELLQATNIIYNQKVDIYSLGIILFEMFHPPLNTGMERMLMLTDLRSKEIILPKDFEKDENEKEIHVIRWLLNHEPSERPTCAELLASRHVPRALGEGALAGMLRHALRERAARPYASLMDTCLDQRPSPAEDLTYHNDMAPGPSDLYCTLKDAVLKVFRSHGAKEFSPPLLIPRARRWDPYTNAVKVMTASGSVCHLPHDFRLPFARHTAYTGIKYMRRYIVDRVYREKRVKGFHPKEMIECAFDIVTPKTDSLWSDAELLVVASRAAMDSNLKVAIQLNHTELLNNLLVMCGVPMDKHEAMYQVLVDASLGRITILELQSHLNSFCVTKQDFSSLLTLLDADVGAHEIREYVAPLIKQAKWTKVLSPYFTILEVLSRNAKALGCECPIKAAPFLASNATHYSGIFWQMSVVRNRRRTKPRTADIIAAGGRYDILVEEFWKLARTGKEESSELQTCSVGFSMSLERMAAILKKTDQDVPKPIKSIKDALICVCVWGAAGSGRDGQAAARRAALCRDLWAAGLVCFTWAASSADVYDATRADIVLRDDDRGVLVFCREGLGFREYKMPYVDVVDFIKQLPLNTLRNSENSSSRSMNWSESEKSNSCITSVTFITAGERMTKNTKRQCESQINTQIFTILLNLGMQSMMSRVRVNVLALSCEAACVRMLAGTLSVPIDHEELDRAFKPVYDAFPKRHNILDDVHQELVSLAKQCNQSRSTEEVQLYALYSIPDSLCRLIT